MEASILALSFVKCSHQRGLCVNCLVLYRLVDGYYVLCGMGEESVGPVNFDLSA